MKKETKKLLADMKKRMKERLAERRAEGKCCAILFHGPGHQSKTFCQKLGKHRVHECIYGCYEQEASWRGMEKCTGFFDEAPEED